MKLVDALKLQAGDLIDLNIPIGRHHGAYTAKVLVVTSHGGIFFVPSSKFRSWGWTQYRWAKSLGRREELTDQERLLQISVTAGCNAYRIGKWEKERKQLLRNRRPDELYRFVLMTLEDGEPHALEELQELARGRGMEADAVTWARIKRVLGCEASENWQLAPPRSVIVMPKLYIGKCPNVPDAPAPKNRTERSDKIL